MQLRIEWGTKSLRSFHTLWSVARDWGILNSLKKLSNFSLNCSHYIYLSMEKDSSSRSISIGYFVVYSFIFIKIFLPSAKKTGILRHAKTLRRLRMNPGTSPSGFTDKLIKTETIKMF